MYLYRKKERLLPPQGCEISQSLGGFSELVHPCSCVCNSVSDTQLSWDKGQAKTVMWLVVSFFCIG